MTHPLLRLRGLSAHAEGTGVPLLDGISLTVPAGSVTAVIGPSGAGKTTLGLAALASSRPGVRIEGEVTLEGTELLALSEARRRSLRSGVTGHLPQHPGTVLDPVRRTGGALRELAALRHRGRAARQAAVRRALERSGLAEEEVRRRFPHQLSGGQQQRTALASALVTGARLLVLDEPTSSLDPAGADALARTLASLAREGAGLLLLSHDLALVRRLAAHVTVLEHGRAVQQGPVEGVLGRALVPSRRHPLTAGLLSAERRTGTGARTGTGWGGTQGGTPTGLRPGAVSEKAPSPSGAARSEGAPSPGTTAPGASGIAAPGTSGVAASGVAVRRRRGGSPLPVPVTMSFPPGSRTALTGRSGAGKTTFGRVLAGLTRATEGALSCAGAPLPLRIERRTPAQTAAVQYVHQNTADAFETHRPLLGQIAAAGPLLRGLTAEAAEAEARALAARLGLDAGLLARTPGRLSGGQLQRCALARALMARPALLVCDEVTSGLDVITREAVLDALPGLLAPGRTALLLISHDLAAVEQSAESVAVFEEGGRVRHVGVEEFLRP